MRVAQWSHFAGSSPCKFSGLWPRACPTVQLRLPILVSLAMCVLAGCQTPQQRKAAENAPVNKTAAEEIARICALHGAERDAELKKLKAASGLDLYCPTE